MASGAFVFLLFPEAFSQFTETLCHALCVFFTLKPYISERLGWSPLGF